VRSVDVGCLQIKLMFDPGAFASLDQAFAPTANALDAAHFLNRYRDRVMALGTIRRCPTGNWIWRPHTRISSRAAAFTLTSPGPATSMPRLRPAILPWRTIPEADAMRRANVAATACQGLWRRLYPTPARPLLAVRTGMNGRRKRGDDRYAAQRVRT
jgi:hypothetical protein